MRISSSLLRGKSHVLIRTKETEKQKKKIFLLSHNSWFFRMPNIRKLVLPRWCNLSENSYRFAFSQWKNLHTLIISPLFYVKEVVKFRVIGENCTNLTNLKRSGYVDQYVTEEIVRYLPKVKRLSMRCCVIDTIQEVSLLISCLQNLTILNVSHCMFRILLNDSLFDESFIKNATRKIQTLIMCSKVGCRLCEDRCSFLETYAFYEKHWWNDEIKELEFWNFKKLCWCFFSQCIFSLHMWLLLLYI